MSIRIKPLEWKEPTGQGYAYKSAIWREWRCINDHFSYIIRHKTHNPNARIGYLTKPYDPYFMTTIGSDHFQTLDEAKAHVQAYHDKAVLSQIIS